ncbi:MAG: hypothetical protein HRT57_11955 [Crocinitomicaceae bacterium]|nr:hypothetical protein [Crocinitomicaceae bacterium]
MMKHLLLVSLLFIACQVTASQWTQRSSLEGTGRHRACGVGLGNRGYIGLGHYNGVGFEVYYNDWWTFDPATNSWTQKAIYPGNNGNGELGCHCWAYDNKVYVGLGEVEHEELYRFDPATNSWEQMTSAPLGINFQDTQEMVLADRAYFMNVFTAELYKYLFASDNWSLVSTIPIPLNFTYSACTYDDNFWVKADYTMYMYETATDLWYEVFLLDCSLAKLLKAQPTFF